MTLDQLMGRHFRLKRELAIAYTQKPWCGPLLDRLANDLSETERLIAERR